MRPPGPGLGRRILGSLAALAVAVGLPGQAVAGAQEDRRPAALEVRVRSDGGTPVRGARVRLARADGGGEAEAERSARAGPDGLARFADVPPGVHLLRVSAMDHAPSVRRLRLTAGRTLRVEIELARRPLPLADLRAGGRGGGFRLEAERRTVLVTGAERGEPELGAWLRRLPGVQVRRYGPGGREVMTLRGSRPEGVLVLLDGMPLNDPLTGEADLSTVPLVALDSAVLVRGAEAEAGPGALAGALELYSRRPGGDRARVGAEMGSFGRRGVELALGTSGRTAAASLTAAWQGARNDFAYRDRTLPTRPVEVRRNADVERWRADLSVAASGPPVAGRVSVSGTERGTPGRMGTELFDRARWSERSVEASGLAGRLEGLHARVGARQVSLRYRDPRHGVDDRHTLSDVRLRGGLPLRLPGELGRLEVRGHAERSLAEGDRLEGVSPRLAGGLAAAARVSAGRWTVRPGLAVDGAPAERAWNPSLAATLQASDGVALWARAGQAHRLPAPGDLYFASAHRLQPNPDLRAEKVRLDGEVGASWRGSRMAVRTALWHRRTAHPIVWMASSTAVWSPRNLDGLAASGVELEARWRPAPGWRVAAVGALSHSRVRAGTSVAPLPYHASVELAASLGWRRGGRILDLDAEYTGPRATSMSGTHHLDGVGLVHARARQELRVGGRPAAVELRILNALDARYEWVALFPEPGRRLELRVDVAARREREGR